MSGPLDDFLRTVVDDVVKRPVLPRARAAGPDAQDDGPPWHTLGADPSWTLPPSCPGDPDIPCLNPPAPDGGPCEECARRDRLAAEREAASQALGGVR